MNRFKNVIALLVCIPLTVLLSACSTSNKNAPDVSVLNQGGNESKNTTSTINSPIIPVSSNAATSSAPAPVAMRITPTETEKPQYIDEAAINIIEGFLEKSEDFGFIEQFKTGAALSIEDLKKYMSSAHEKEILDDLQQMDESRQETEIWLTDIDNDGADEIAVSQYQGGTMGLVYFTVFKKDAHGEYRAPEQFSYEFGITFFLNDTLNICRLANKNYLLVEQADFDTKAIAAIHIYCFVDGEYAECAAIDLFSEKIYTLEEGTENPKYRDYMNTLNMNELIQMTKAGNEKTGTAEKAAAEFVTEADINNDGVHECLKKRYKHTSAYYYASYLDLEINGSDTALEDGPFALESEPLDAKGNQWKYLQQVWCDRFEQKNLLGVLYSYYTDAGYYLDIYLFDGDKQEKVGWMKAEPERNIGVTYYGYSLAPVG